MQPIDTFHLSPSKTPFPLSVRLKLRTGEEVEYPGLMNACIVEDFLGYSWNCVVITFATKEGPLEIELPVVTILIRD